MKNTKNTKKNFWENFRFDFALYINEHKHAEDDDKNGLICHRALDVRNYNEDVLNSVELKELMDVITGIHTPTMGIIPKCLKKQSEDVLWGINENPRKYKKNINNYIGVKDLFENEDIYTFEIKVDKKVVAKTSFYGNYFPTDIRYAVNIREVIPEIISEIQEYFSRDEYTMAYEGVELKNGLATADFEV